MLAYKIINFSMKTNVIFLHSLLLEQAVKVHAAILLVALRQEEGPNLNVVFTGCNEQILRICWGKHTHSPQEMSQQDQNIKIQAEGGALQTQLLLHRYRGSEVMTKPNYFV